MNTNIEKKIKMDNWVELYKRKVRDLFYQYK